MDLNELRENYKQLGHNQIIEIAKYQANELSSDALIVLKEEILRRELSESLIDAVEITTKELSEEELKGYIDLIRDLPIRLKIKNNEPLNAVIVKECIGVPLVGAKVSRSLYFGSAEQIQVKLKEAYKATASSLILGIPFGLFSSINTLNELQGLRDFDYSITVSPTLVTFIRENLADIDRYKDDDKMLAKLINLKVD